MDKKILVIDDNEQDQKIMKRHLSVAGYDNVIFAESGEVGLEKTENEKPNLIIADTQLPGIDGFEVCKKIKENDALNAKVIMMTGVIDAVDAGKAREMGADDYCVKTADCVPLIEAIGKLI